MNALPKPGAILDCLCGRVKHLSYRCHLFSLKNSNKLPSSVIGIVGQIGHQDLSSSLPKLRFKIRSPQVFFFILSSTWSCKTRQLFVAAAGVYSTALVIDDEILFSVNCEFFEHRSQHSGSCKCLQTLLLRALEQFTNCNIIYKDNSNEQSRDETRAKFWKVWQYINTIHLIFKTTHSVALCPRSYTSIARIRQKTEKNHFWHYIRMTNSSAL